MELESTPTVFAVGQSRGQIQLVLGFFQSCVRETCTMCIAGHRASQVRLGRILHSVPKLDCKMLGRILRWEDIVTGVSPAC